MPLLSCCSHSVGACLHRFVCVGIVVCVGMRWRGGVCALVLVPGQDTVLIVFGSLRPLLCRQLHLNPNYNVISRVSCCPLLSSTVFHLPAMNIKRWHAGSGKLPLEDIRVFVCQHTLWSDPVSALLTLMGVNVGCKR